MERAVENRPGKQGLEVVLEIRGSMHLAPSLRSLKEKRDKLLQHFRRRNTTDSAESTETAPAVASSDSVPSTGSNRSSTIDADSDRRKSTPPEASRLGSIPSSGSAPSSDRTRADSCYTFPVPEPEKGRQVEEAARTNIALATTTEPPSSTDTAIELTTAPTSPKPEEQAAPHTPLAVEAPHAAPVASPPTTDSQDFPPPSTPISPTPRPPFPRRQSIFPPSEVPRITENYEITLAEARTAYDGNGASSPAVQEKRKGTGMVNGKVWVRRREGSATLVYLHEEDLVDNLKDAILKKYQNALARHYDAPDLQLRIIPRKGQQREERFLSPEEIVLRTLNDYYPGGQSVPEALVIEVPPLRERERKTPRPSPNQLYAYYGGHHEAFAVAEGSEYFPIMPAPAPSHQASHPSSNLNSSQIALSQPAMSALTAGQVPSVPASPGTRRLHNRPPMRNRIHTASAAVVTNPIPSGSSTPVLLLPKGSRITRVNSEPSNLVQNQTPTVPPLPTPPIPEEITPPPPIATSPPPTRVASPRPKKFIKNETKSKSGPTGLMEGTVPPINVLIVEDNIINLKLLEAFMKRLKVRWQSAMDGLDAVNKWRSGGFHLVLMDIHLPKMNGLEATKEIRRLERVNGIGVFSPSPRIDDDESPEVDDIPEDDRLSSSFLFKSPVIIVALTASSLQSDRHEALAAGCNDFLTKVWLSLCMFIRKEMN